MIEGITVVQFRLDKRGGDNTGCFRVESSTDATKITNVEIASSGEIGYLIVEGEVGIKYDAEVPCRVDRSNCGIIR